MESSGLPKTSQPLEQSVFWCEWVDWPREVEAELLPCFPKNKLRVAAARGLALAVDNGHVDPKQGSLVWPTLELRESSCRTWLPGRRNPECWQQHMQRLPILWSHVLGFAERVGEFLEDLLAGLGVHYF